MTDIVSAPSSEAPAPAPVESSPSVASEPAADRSSSQSIAAEVIAEAEGAGDSAPYLGGDGALPAAPVMDAPPIKLSPAAEFLKAQGHQAQKVDGRAVWLPYGTVEKMLDRYVDQHKSGWDGEKTLLASERDQYRQHIESLRQTVSGDPENFLKEIAKADPRYARFLQQQAAQAQTPVRQESRAQTQEPGPDVPLGDGSYTYSVEGLRAREEWRTQQILAMMDERLKPITEREAHVAQQQQEQAFQQAAQTRYAQTMQEATTWPGFGALPADGSLTAFQQNVLAELQQDTDRARAQGQRPMMTLRQAYLEVQAKSQQPDQVRARILEELKTAPKAPSLTRQGAESSRSRGPRTSADIAREVLAQASES